VPHWATDLKICRSTFNARSKTVATKSSFREGWKRAQHCIIPAQAIYVLPPTEN
jgi:putative SOS response-associated peptidase YedK